MFLVNSRYRRFSAALLGSIREGLHLTRAHLIPKLRCEFAEFLHKGSLKRLGILSPSTCVGLRYGQPGLSLEVFLGSMESPAVWPEGLDITPQRYGTTDLPVVPAYTLEPAHPMAGRTILLRHPFVRTIPNWYRTINLFPIDYAFRPRLRDRLTLSGLTFLRKP